MPFWKAVGYIFIILKYSHLITMFLTVIGFILCSTERKRTEKKPVKPNFIGQLKKYSSCPIKPFFILSPLENGIKWLITHST